MSQKRRVLLWLEGIKVAHGRVVWVSGTYATTLQLTTGTHRSSLKLSSFYVGVYLLTARERTSYMSL